MMRRFLLILQAAAAAGVIAYGLIDLWHDWKISHAPFVERFEIHLVSSPKGWGI
jgi:hypothetical protein